MAEEANNLSSREQRIDEAIAELLDIVESGKTFDRQAFLGRHADIAAEIEAFLADRQRFAQLADDLKQDTAPDKSPEGQETLVPGEAPAGDSLGTVRYFGDYELLEEIARGGMGVVYKAQQVSLKRTVALKMILAGQLASAADVQRFRKEAEAAANLKHSNIVAIHEVGQHEGQHYFSMDYIPGRSLADLVREGPLPPKQAARYVRIIAEAVQFAHQHGTLHRDLKPSNILIDGNDQPHVTGFGLAKRVASGQCPVAGAHNAASPSPAASDSAPATHLTATGQVLGTPSYMPPEQAGGKRGQVGPASDVYALGAILYDLVTGRPPFQAATALDTLLQVLDAEPVSPRLLNPMIDRDMETMCLKCLQKEPNRRYDSAQALADDLERYLNGQPIHARPIGDFRRFWRWCRRNPRVALLSGAVLLLLVMLPVAVNLVWRSESRKTSAALDESRHHLYLTHVTSAHHALAAGQDVRAWDLLLPYASPAARQSDPRGWEWHYLSNRCRIRLVLSTRRAGRMIWSPDGKKLAMSGAPRWEEPKAIGSDVFILVWDVAGALQAGRRVLDQALVIQTPAMPVAWSRDGRRLVGNFDWAIWDVAKQSPGRFETVPTVKKCR
jgi:serine/threonine protein kinase